jgi:hypothetical protein
VIESAVGDWFASLDKEIILFDGQINEKQQA